MAETPELDRSNLFFEVGVEYRDTGSPNKSEDQFLRWINIPGSGMKNMGGIRWLKTKSKKRQNSDGIVLVSSHLNTDSHNPWDDIVDFHLGASDIGECQVPSKKVLTILKEIKISVGP